MRVSIKSIMIIHCSAFFQYFILVLYLIEDLKVGLSSKDSDFFNWAVTFLSLGMAG